MNQPADLSYADQGRGVLFQRAVVLGTCTLVTILYAMTVTIANVSLPQMQGALSVTQDQITWVVTFNIVATAVATPLTGWLVGRFGRRRLLSLSSHCSVYFSKAYVREGNGFLWYGCHLRTDNWSSCGWLSE